VLFFVLQFWCFTFSTGFFYAGIFGFVESEHSDWRNKKVDEKNRYVGFV
jgi:hypothetical protein